MANATRAQVKKRKYEESLGEVIEFPPWVSESVERINLLLYLKDDSLIETSAEEIQKAVVSKVQRDKYLFIPPRFYEAATKETILHQIQKSILKGEYARTGKLLPSKRGI